jgi:hypothetical protein
MLDSDPKPRQELIVFLRAAEPRAWITLDDSMRASWHGDVRPTHATKTSAFRRLFSGLRNVDVLDRGIASMGRDGRVREAAVRELSTETDPLAGPFLALRTVDWVDQVRDAATEILGERLSREIAFAVAAAPVVLALVDRRRSSELSDVVFQRAANDHDVRAALLDADTHTSRRVIADEPVRNALTLDELLTLAVSRRDPELASIAGVTAVSRLQSTDRDDAFERLLRGPALVRRAVLDALQVGEHTRQLAEKRLFDRSAAVRAAAQRALARAHGDSANVYRQALSQGEHVAVSILELASVGGKHDQPLILDALNAPGAATRRAAVNAVRWFAGDRLLEWLVPMLEDTSPGVTRAAERRLRSQAKAIDPAVLSRLAQAPASHNRRAAYRLLRRRTAPERIEADLLALADPAVENQQAALGDLRSWLAKGAASAPRADLPTRRRLSDELDRVESQMGPETAEAVRFHAALRSADLQTQAMGES